MILGNYQPALNLSYNLTREVDGLRPRESVFLHYSTLESFYSIMDTARLRFTSVKSTNDPSEFLFGKDVLDRALLEALEGATAAERSIINEAILSAKTQDFRAFVFCMSEALGDEAEVGELSQWRLYGADGLGIGLVFDVSNSQRQNLLQRLTSIPRLVTYGEADGMALVKQEIRAFLDGIHTLPADTQTYLRENPSAAGGYLSNCIFWLPSVIKHKAYRHEREVRLIRGDIGESAGNPLVFYEKGLIRRPAIELPISDFSENSPQSHHASPIRKVIIGPSGDQSAIEDSIRFFLEARNWNLEIARSDIPYRAV